MVGWHYPTMEDFPHFSSQRPSTLSTSEISNISNFATPANFLTGSIKNPSTSCTQTTLSKNSNTNLSLLTDTKQKHSLFCHNFYKIATFIIIAIASYQLQSPTVTMKVSLSDINQNHPRSIPVLMALAQQAKQYALTGTTPNPGSNNPAPARDTSWSLVTSKKHAQAQLVPIAISIPIKKDLTPVRFRHPVSIIIRPNKNQDVVVTHDCLKIMENLLTACKIVDKECYFGPVDLKDPQLGAISSDEDQPKDLVTLSKYFDQTTVDEKGVFSGRLYLHTDEEFYKFKCQPKFLKWLRESSMTFEVNHLPTIVLHTVGFLMKQCVRADLTDVYTARARAELDPECPLFQTYAEWMKVGDDTKACRILLIKARKEDIPEVTKAFRVLDETVHGVMTFYPWNQFVVLNDKQRMTLAEEQQTFQAYYRSIRVDGFTELIDTKMWERDPQDSTMLDDNAHINDGDALDSPKSIFNGIKLHEVSVRDFILKYYKNANGNAIIEYLYTPQLGSMEILVNTDNQKDGQKLATALVGDLAYIMSDVSLAKVFCDPAMASTLGITQDRWTPYYLTAMIAESETPLASATKKRRVYSPTPAQLGQTQVYIKRYQSKNRKSITPTTVASPRSDFSSVTNTPLSQQLSQQTRSVTSYSTASTPRKFPPLTPQQHPIPVIPVPISSIQPPTSTFGMSDMQKQMDLKLAQTSLDLHNKMNELSQQLYASKLDTQQQLSQIEQTMSNTVSRTVTDAIDRLADRLQPTSAARQVKKKQATETDESYSLFRGDNPMDGEYEGHDNSLSSARQS